MPQSLSKVYVHLTFSTKLRRPLIDDAVKHDLWEYFGGVCKSLECPPLRVGGASDHIHICCLLSKKIAQMKLAEDVKRLSSKWIKTRSPEYWDFYWQKGYAIFSVNPTDVDSVIHYIDRQEEHHRQKTFKEELLLFLKKYGAEYDERFLWE
ncbi:MAG: IS200/IS605 family transposase [Desulfovibrio sp.]|nr:IS200/IS605 family transposase [Desulfovibrio sp.]